MGGMPTCQNFCGFHSFSAKRNNRGVWLSGQLFKPLAVLCVDKTGFLARTGFSVLSQQDPEKEEVLLLKNLLLLSYSMSCNFFYSWRQSFYRTSTLSKRCFLSHVFQSHPNWWRERALLFRSSATWRLTDCIYAVPGFAYVMTKQILIYHSSLWWQ